MSHFSPYFCKYSLLKVVVSIILLISKTEADECKYKPCIDVDSVKTMKTFPHTMCEYPATLDHSKPKCTSKLAKAGLTQADRIELLNKHNEYRQKIAQGKAEGQPKAANMMKFKWNSELEAIAQRFMNSCPDTVAHDKCRNMLDGTLVGQNSAENYIEYKKDPKMPEAMAKAVTQWYDEVKLMTPAIVNDVTQAQPIFEKVGHYTQLAWAKTTMVGCGYVQHNPDNEVYQTFVLNCNYVVAGNEMDPNTPVYIVGEPCSKCPEKAHCSKRFPGLCTDEKDEYDDVPGEGKDHHHDKDHHYHHHHHRHPEGCSSVLDVSTWVLSITVFLVWAQSCYSVLK